MSPNAVDRVLRPRNESGVPALLVALLRIGAGVFFVTVSIGKFADHMQEAADFDRYGVPAPDVAVTVVGVIELTCGVLLILGLLTRPAAGLLVLTLIGAISTAGRVDGGSFHLGVGPTALAVMVVLLWTGAGRPSLDSRWQRRLVQDHAV